MLSDPLRLVAKLSSGSPISNQEAVTLVTRLLTGLDDDAAGCRHSRACQNCHWLGLGWGLFAFQG